MAWMFSGDKKFPQVAMDNLWHGILSCVNHGVLWIWKADYAERQQRSRETRAAGETALHEALAAVAANVRFRADAGSPLVVFNFQGWPATGPVEFAFEGDPAGLVLRDEQGGEAPLQVEESEAPPSTGSRLAFLAHDVPACGYRTYYLTRAAKDRGPAKPSMQQATGPIENDCYRLQLAANGKLQVWDKNLRKRLGAADGGLGDVVLYDAPVPADNWVMNGPLGKRHDWEAQPATFQSCQGPVFALLRANGQIGPHKIQREVRVWQATRRIEFQIDIDAAAGAPSSTFAARWDWRDGFRPGSPSAWNPARTLDREPFRGEFFALGYPDTYYATRWTDVSTKKFGYTLIAPHGVFDGYVYKPQEQAMEFALLRIRPFAGNWGKWCRRR